MHQYILIGTYNLQYSVTSGLFWDVTWDLRCDDVRLPEGEIDQEQGHSLIIGIRNNVLKTVTRLQKKS